jgi:hypothetical protein
MFCICKLRACLWYIKHVKREVLKAVKITMFLWFVTQCGLTGIQTFWRNMLSTGETTWHQTEKIYIEHIWHVMEQENDIDTTHVAEISINISLSMVSKRQDISSRESGVTIGNFTNFMLQNSTASEVYLLLQHIGSWKWSRPTFQRCLLPRLHGAISQKAVIFILAVGRTWNLT